MEIFPVFAKNNVLVVFAANDKYAKYLGVVIYSLVEHASIDYSYDICILENNISTHYKNLILNMQSSNISIRFINMCEQYAQLPEAYYRLFIPRIFNNYQTAIYLDSDIIIQRDVAELAQIDIGYNLLGAVRDIAVIMRCSNNTEGLLDYCKNILQMDNYTNYFNSGVLVWNIAQTQVLLDTFIERLKDNTNFRYYDQDILNPLCENRVFFIPSNWNYVRPIRHKYTEEALSQVLSEFICHEYQISMTNPYIIHFASNCKPWIDPKRDKHSEWWRYARMTPFAEEIIYENLINIMDKNFNTITQRLTKLENQQKYPKLIYTIINKLRRNG